MNVLEGIGLVADTIIIGVGVGWLIGRLRAWSKKFSADLRFGMRH